MESIPTALLSSFLLPGSQNQKRLNKEVLDVTEWFLLALRFKDDAKGISLGNTCKTLGFPTNGFAITFGPMSLVCTFNANRSVGSVVVVSGAAKRASSVQNE